MTNIRALITYCGTRYYGFQKTNVGPSIQSTLEEVLQTLLQHPVQIQAASRTDRGVHAKGQVVNFFTKKSPNLNKLHQALRKLLPPDISILELSEENEDFHPTLDNLGKHYSYKICNDPTQLPFDRELSWHFYYPLDIEKMQRAAIYIEGNHDFTAFSKMKYQNPLRTVKKISIISLPQNHLNIDIFGDHFLYKMARTIVGTLAYIGCGRIEVEEIPKILASKQRARAGVTAPAHGLYLERVLY